MAESLTLQFSRDEYNTNSVDVFTARNDLHNGGSSKIIVNNGGIDREKKEYVLDDLNALKKMKQFISRPGGDVSIRESSFKDSVSVDFKTSLFSYMKLLGFTEMKSCPDIVDICATRIVTADTKNACEAAVEMLGEAIFNCGGEEFSVRLKMFNTNCSVQVQVMGDDEDRKEFVSKMKLTTAEYFANVIVKFAKNIMVINPNIDNDERFLPKNLTEEIKRLEELKKFGAKKGSDFACPECGTIMKGDSELKNHVKSAHVGVKKVSHQPEDRFTISLNDVTSDSQFVCNVCEFSSKSEKGVKLHITIKHGRRAPELDVLPNNQSGTNILTFNSTEDSTEKCNICFQPINSNHIDLEICSKCKCKEHSSCAVGTCDDLTNEYICPSCALHLPSAPTPTPTETTKAVVSDSGNDVESLLNEGDDNESPNINTIYESSDSVQGQGEDDKDEQIFSLNSEVNQLKMALDEAKKKEECQNLHSETTKEQYDRYTEKLRNTIVEINLQLLRKENSFKQLETTNQNLVNQIENANSTEKDKANKKLKEETQKLNKEKTAVEEDFRVVLAQNERTCARLKTLESTIEALQDLLKFERDKRTAEATNAEQTSEVPEPIIPNTTEENTTNVHSINPDPTAPRNNNIDNTDAADNPLDTDLRGQEEPTQSDPRDIDVRPNYRDEERRQFCHFWNNGYCRYSANDCKFRHEESPYCESSENCTIFRCQFYHESFLSWAPRGPRPPPPPPRQHLRWDRHQQLHQERDQFLYREREWPRLAQPVNRL